MFSSCSTFQYVDCSQDGAGPLILSWINEICSDDTEKRALLVAMGNDLAYVVQAVVSRIRALGCSRRRLRCIGTKLCVEDDGLSLGPKRLSMVYRAADIIE